MLERRGVASRRVSHAAVSRDAIADFDLNDVTAFVVSYLELAGTPTLLRSLLRRLRTRAPAARIVVGLWPEGDATLGNEHARQVLGADACVGSLRAAIDASLAPAAPLAR